MKTCRICKRTMVPELFGNSKKYKDGKATICRDCERERSKLWRAKNIISPDRAGRMDW